MKPSENCLMPHETKLCRYQKSGLCKFSASTCWFKHSSGVENKIKVNNIYLEENKNGKTDSKKIKRNKRNRYRLKSKLRDQVKENQLLRDELLALKMTMQDLIISMENHQKNAFLMMGL